MISRKKCRICMLNCGFKSLCPIFDDGSIIFKKLQALNLNIIKNVNLPDKICVNCIEELNVAVRFIETSKKSEETYLEALKNISKFEQNDLATISPSKSNVVQAPDDGKIENSAVKLEANDESIPPECIVKIEEESVLPPEEVAVSLVKPKQSNKRAHRVFEQGQLNTLEQKEIDETASVACKICSKIFLTQSMLNRHSVRHLLFICGFCYQEFNKKPVLKRHIFDEHVQSMANIKCLYHPDCDKVFKEKTYMLAHTFAYHDNKRCSICNKLYSSWGVLKNHYDTVHTDKRDFLCSLCGKGFSSRRSLNAHLNIHGTEKRYSCDLCSNKYISRSALSYHTSSIHRKKKPYVCNFENCNMKFTVPSLLKNHQRRHTGEKPYKCDFCKLSFKQLKHRQNHHRTHTGERPYKCSFDKCKSAFAQQNDLRLHQRIHTGEKPHICPCGAAFRINSALKTHMKIHRKPDSGSVDDNNSGR